MLFASRHFVHSSLLAVLAWAACQTPLVASGTVHKIVVNADAKAGTAGYTLEIDTRWTDLGGYRPVRVSITPHQASSIDTEFSLQFHVSSRNFYFRGRENRGTTVVEQKVTIPSSPSGSQPPATTATLSVPQHHGWDRFTLQVWEDGQHRPKLSVENINLGTQGRMNFGQNALMSTCVLEVDSQATAPASFPVFGGGSPGSVPITPNEMPERWTDWTSVDAVTLKFEELKKLAKQHPQKWQALRSWVVAGGNLWVTDVGKIERDKGFAPRLQWQNLTELERLLELAPRERTGSAWQNTYQDQGVALGLLRVRNVRLGQVVALPDNNAWESRFWQNGQWNQAVQALGASRMQWEQRMGVMLDLPNAGFWDFLIPGVGQVPVTVFQVLITLFVVVIGPLNYIYLKRRGKLHMLVVTVPICALLVTLSLFGYALATDGLGIRVRARSYTEIDQRRGEAVCWSRLCYYAGLAPSQGLRFSGDTVILPIDPKIDAPTSDTTRSLDWKNDGDQHLKSGWLRSRNLTQYLTLRARRTDAHLKITPDPTGGLSIDNQLGTTIRYLVVSDADGKLYPAEAIRPAATAVLTSGDDDRLAAVCKPLVQVFHDNQPAPPKGIDAQDVFGYSRYYGFVRRATSPNTDRLEGTLAEVRSQVGQRKLAPQTYVALVERSPEVEFGVPSARQEASFHIVVGRW